MTCNDTSPWLTVIRRRDSFSSCRMADRLAHPDIDGSLGGTTRDKVPLQSSAYFPTIFSKTTLARPIVHTSLRLLPDTLVRVL